MTRRVPPMAMPSAAPRRGPSSPAGWPVTGVTTIPIATRPDAAGDAPDAPDAPGDAPVALRGAGPPARWPGGAVRLVAVPGGMLPVETIGRGPPLLLLHGWTLDRRMWRPQLALADRVTLVGIDRRGFGDATAPADLAAEPDDVLRVADALGIERFHLLGMSQGGRVALALAARTAGAARTSGRLLSLTLQGTALDGPEGDDEAVPLAAMADAARRGDLAGLRRLWGAHPLMHAATPAGAALAAAMLADYAGRDLGASGALAASAAAIAGAAFPVTAIVGARDTARRRANVAALAAVGARAVVLPGAGHLCNIDAAAGFNAALAGALDPLSA
ncbi:MAG: hypothetical protein DCF31_16960 [Alphaproteobacteria bacterium]|nr:MAG: hypothetical protein DCF31_16960 [Alphaproteobacteria bacterium]